MSDFLRVTGFFGGLVAVVFAFGVAASLLAAIFDLPFFVAIVVLFTVIVVIGRVFGRRFPEPGLRLAYVGRSFTGYPVATWAVIAGWTFIFGVAWSLSAGESWTETLTFALGVASVLVLFGLADQAVRRRAVRKRGIAAADYSPGNLADLAFFAPFILALGAVAELSSRIG